MKDKNVYQQAVLQIVETFDFLSTEDVRKVANIAESFYRQGYEDAYLNVPVAVNGPDDVDE
jgi:hypothetical protein